MRRIEFASPELADFASLGRRRPRQGVRPRPRRAERRRHARLYAARLRRRARDADDRLRPARGGAGDRLGARRRSPATRSRSAARGARRSSPTISTHYLLIGDETALPAIGRRVEGLRPGVPVTTIVGRRRPGRGPDFRHARRLAARLAFSLGTRTRRRGAAARSARRMDAAAGRRLRLDRRRGASRPRAEDAYARGARHPKAWLKASGYWVRGKAGESEKFEG